MRFFCLSSNHRDTDIPVKNVASKENIDRSNINVCLVNDETNICMYILQSWQAGKASHFGVEMLVMCVDDRSVEMNN